MLKQTVIAALAGAAFFVAGCGQDAMTADEIAQLRKDVSELRAEVKNLSRRVAHQRPLQGAPDAVRAQRPATGPRRIQRGEGGGDAKASARTPEERKARMEEMRRRHEERKRMAEERRAKRAASGGGGQAGAPETADQPAQEASRQTDNQ